jgi:hypothetical protein
MRQPEHLGRLLNARLKEKRGQVAQLMAVLNLRSVSIWISMLVTVGRVAQRPDGDP